jgi:protein-S-isoprenylcysteine O-methyltransferase Ste14
MSEPVGNLFKTLWAFWALYWLVSAWGNKRPAFRPSPAWRLFGLVAVLAACLVLRRFPEYFSRRILSPNAPRSAACLCLAAAGIGLSIWARVALGRNWNSTPMIKEGHELIEKGPYRFVRHPIYTGLLLAIFATCLSDGRLADAYLFGLAAIFLTWKLKVEESLMVRMFPEAYADYRRRTKALVPFLF